MKKLELEATKESEKTYKGKPLQNLPYSEKVKNDNQWGKETMKYYIDQCSYGQSPNFSTKEFRNKQALYDAYNNKIPQTLFDYVSDPLKAEQAKHKRFPAKIRSYNILRPNIDLLIGEWNKRPFYYDVVNADGEDAINTFEMVKTKTYKDNVTQRYINKVNELKEREGEEATDVPSEEISDPKLIMSELNVNYKDAKALKGYRALKVLELELKIREIWRRLFKDWLIAGEVYTMKFPLHGDIRYLKLSTLSVDCDKSGLSPNVEDGEFASVRFKVSTSDIVDLFYDKLKKEDIKEIESDPAINYSSKVFNMFGKSGDDSGAFVDKHDLYYVCWQSMKVVGLLKYPDPITQETQYDIVDEDYKPQAELGEEVEWMTVKEAWNGWRIGEDKYIGIEAVQAQRNEMNNFAACKLPINGRRFSDTESENISVLWLGMPYQILYIILMYRLELTIAKSKGKIFLLDKNIIPDEDDGGEEGFFWYSEAMGYALVDGSKVNPRFNQYQTVDMSLFKDIKELIELTQYVKGEWDDLIGFTRQRKGQNTGSDGKGVNEQSIFRSSVISDLIFTGFEEFLESELSGLQDTSKYAWADGKKGYWRNDAGRLEMLALEPEEYVNSSFGVHVQNMSTYLDKFNMLKNQINAIAQRKDVKTSTIIDLTFTESLTELKALVKKAEAIDQDLAMKTAKNEQDAQASLEESKRRWEIFMHSLEVDKQEKDWDRKDNNTIIQGEIAGRVAKDPSGMDIDFSEVQKQANDRLKTMYEASDKRAKNELEKGWQQIERDKMKSNEKIARDKNKVALKNKVSGEK